MDHQKDINDLALALKALGNEKRLCIIKYLASHPSCITGSIVDKIALAQSTTSQHLKVLKNAGIIKGTIEGTSTNYCLDRERLHYIEQLLTHYFEEVNHDSK